MKQTTDGPKSEHQTDYTGDRQTDWNGQRNRQMCVQCASRRAVLLLLLLSSAGAARSAAAKNLVRHDVPSTGSAVLTRTAERNYFQRDVPSAGPAVPAAGAALAPRRTCKPPNRQRAVPVQGSDLGQETLGASGGKRSRFGNRETTRTNNRTDQ